MKDLQKEKISHKFKPEDNKLFEILKSVSYHGDCDSYDPISAYKWIQQNYVSKDKVRGLKMEEVKEYDYLMALKESRIIEIEQFGYSGYDQFIGYQEAVDKFNNSIDKIIK